LQNIRLPDLGLSIQHGTCYGMRLHGVAPRGKITPYGYRLTLRLLERSIGRNGQPCYFPHPQVVSLFGLARAGGVLRSKAAGTVVCYPLWTRRLCLLGRGPLCHCWSYQYEVHHTRRVSLSRSWEHVSVNGTQTVLILSLSL
jgi:hypothetical protein